LESQDNLRLEIGHVLFIDLVGYSRLLIEDQRERLSQLTEIVLQTPQVRAAPNEQLIRLPTGDGMALVFRNSAEEPAQCALEIAQALKACPDLQVRMGIHSGPVSEVIDVSGRTNIAGAGINMAQRVMDCGDAGHILLSKRVADDLSPYRQWSVRLNDLGECEVKHGLRLHLFNLSTDELGNREVPEKLHSATAPLSTVVGPAPGRKERWRAGAPMFRRLTFRNGYIANARFTPDGNEVVYGAAWEGRPIEIFMSRMGSPESRSLGLPPANLLAISQSGEMAISLGYRNTFWYQVAGTLARTSLAGGGVRRLLENTGHADWAPDGNAMAVVHYVDRRCRLEYPAGRVIHETPEWISHPKVSKDGRRVAFIEHRARGHTDGDVCIFDEDGQVRALASGLTAGSGIVWSPSGTEIWFSGIDETQHHGVWAVDLEGNRRLLLPHSHRVFLHDVAEDGRALISIGTLRAEAHADAGPDSPDINISWFDGAFVTDISRDGEQILFFEGHEAENPQYAVYMRSVDGSPGVRLGSGISMRFSPDGKWVLATRFRPEPDLLIYPTGFGEASSLRSPEITRYFWAGWHPDGEQIFILGSDQQSTGCLFRGRRSQPSWSKVWGEEVILDWTDGPPISPDGNRLALRRPDHSLVILDVTSGAVTPLNGLAREDEPIQFDASGRILYVVDMAGSNPRVDRYDLETQERTGLREIKPSIPTGVIGTTAPVVTAEGKGYAYTLMRQLTDLFLVEGLDA
jgi:eukaryotic-like serine/threonine-protein kinase